MWHKGSLGDEDDAQISNTCIAQRKHAIPHSTMKNDLPDIIECCNNTQQGAPHTGKQTSTCTSDLGDCSHVTCYISVAVACFSVSQFPLNTLFCMSVLVMPAVTCLRSIRSIMFRLTVTEI